MIHEYLLEDAAEKVTAEMIKNLEPGAEIELNDEFTLYAYESADSVVLVETKEWIEHLVCMYDGDNVIFEEL